MNREWDRDMAADLILCEGIDYPIVPSWTVAREQAQEEGISLEVEALTLIHCSMYGNLGMH